MLTTNKGIKTKNKTGTIKQQSSLIANKEQARAELKEKIVNSSGLLEPPGLDGFIFSDYSDDNFEDSREAQYSGDESDIENTEIVKRQAVSPLCQDHFKKHKGDKKNPTCKTKQPL